ncbi:se10 [Alphabaculovirus alterspexiguae]|uniref:Se10 n=1 Tax=Spodoptera exigua multiple nucleopolyhedrovirus TaxID=10454 RepID=A0A3G2JTV3_9ABAC|nr:se10 [Spodoptera exigua multiple nucleopolyhedrovirus]AYN44970.1 se10 [Spodoptera exigua multiple nucleopolyhedrovirus]
MFRYRNNNNMMSSYGMPCSYSSDYNQQHDALRHDLRTLKSQVYEICQQSSITDRNLCDRIKNSMDNSSSSTKDVTARYLITGKGKTTNNGTSSAVAVVDTVKY